MKELDLKITELVDKISKEKKLLYKALSIFHTNNGVDKYIKAKEVARLALNVEQSKKWLTIKTQEKYNYDTGGVK